ncbi:MAG: CRTAC1 family protein [Planctomycetota bacterium]|jgi:tetratricopeptide (TPR) repeat protein
MKTLQIIISLLTIGLLTGCQRETISTDSSVTSSKFNKAIVAFNNGAALLEQYNYSQSEQAFRQVLEIEPDWTAARFNLGLARLNMYDQPGDINYVELAKATFETVLESNPDHLPALFCLGVYYQYIGDYQNAQKYLEIVHEKDPNDTYTTYKLAEVLISLGEKEKSIELLEKVIEQDPGFISAFYRLATQYQRTRQPQKARPLFKRFKELKDAELAGGTFTVATSYGSSGKYFMALSADNLPIEPVKTLPKRILFSPELKILDEPVNTWQSSAVTSSQPGIAVGDIDTDGDLDLCITGHGENGQVKIWKNNGNGGFSAETPLNETAVSPCFGDVDDDGDIDLWLGRVGPDVYYENNGTGDFLPSETMQIEENHKPTSCARLLDIDSDGDLDFLAFRLEKGAIAAHEINTPSLSSLYNNNRDGSFTDIAEKLGLTFPETAITAVVYDDFDNDRDLDLVVFPSGHHSPICWVNDRIWEYHVLDDESSGFSSHHVLAATSGDPDKDGDRDLLLFTKEGLKLYTNTGAFKFESHEQFFQSNGRLGGTSGQFVDMDNDGDLDIVIADAFRQDGTRGPTLLINDWPSDRFIDALEIDPGNVLSALKTQADASCVVADFTGDGKCDIVLASMGQKPVLIENITPDGHWIEIDLLGTRQQDQKSRSNNSAIGARVEIKAGNISQQYVVGTPTGPTSLAPYRIHAGLGNYTNIEWMRIIWPDGVLQAELEIPADQVIEITEIQRKTSSCPHLFAWDGSRFAFISDFGGMGGVGYFLGQPGHYAKPDPTEYLLVPNLTARNGEYILQVMEPLEEIVFFDEAKLIAVDHPVGTEVYPNEMMAINTALPEFEIFCYRDTIEPVQVIDHRGVDVTEHIRRIDRDYAGTTELEGRFTGFAKDHFIELDFGERLNHLKSDSRVVLFLYGWVEYGYSTTNFAAHQANRVLEAPTLEVLRKGEWIELFDQVGYPAGINHMMTLDITGKLLPTDKRIRISTNMELYWDKIFLAEVLDHSQISATEAAVKNADFHFLGFPKEFSPDGRHPRLYDYDNIDRTVPWKTMTGHYTRFGEVDELLEEADDCYVIMAPGEEVTLRFSADSFGEIPNGYQRSFILKADSFCKDMDTCSADPLTVEPLPFHEMSNYPYKADEHYPDSEKHRSYKNRFNTRKLYFN